MVFCKLHKPAIISLIDCVIILLNYSKRKFSSRKWILEYADWLAAEELGLSSTHDTIKGVLVWN